MTVDTAANSHVQYESRVQCSLNLLVHSVVSIYYTDELMFYLSYLFLFNFFFRPLISEPVNRRLVGML